MCKFGNRFFVKKIHGYLFLDFERSNENTGNIIMGVCFYYLFGIRIWHQALE